MNREGKKCVLYPRVSTEMQVDGYSLEGQKNSLKRFADREEMEIVGIYEDAGKSGKSIEGRPAFKKMLSDIKNGLEIDYILVYKLSRFGRNAADILNSLEFVQSYGINLICIEEGIDSSQTSGKLLISVLSAVAEIERENIIEQTMNGRKEKARQGGWNGGFAPYGYYLKDNQLLIEETEAEAIRIIFDKFANSDVGLGGVAKYLNLQGIKKIPRQNGTLETWSSHFIRLILDNPVYCGKIAYGRRTREKVKGTKNEYKQVHTDDYILEDGQHEGIVSEELWQKAHTKRMATGIKQPSKIGKDRSHLLTGILKCPLCGSSMYTNKHAWTNKDGTYKEVYYYICGRNKQERGHHCDYKASLRKTDIEPLVIEAVKELVSDKYFAKEIEKRIGVQTDTTAIDKELANYESKLKEVDLNKARLEREIDNLPIDARFRERKIHDMTLRLDGLYDTIVELEERIEDAKLRKSSIEMEAITLDNIYKLMLNFGKLYDIISDEEKKSLITYLIKEIQIYPNGESEQPLKSIEFNFPIYRDGQEVRRLLWEKGNTVETVTLLNQIAADAQANNEALLSINERPFYLVPSVPMKGLTADENIKIITALIVSDEIYSEFVNSDTCMVYWNFCIPNELVETKGLMLPIMEARDLLKPSGLYYESYLNNFGRQLFYVISGSYTTLYMGFMFLIIACALLALQFLTQMQTTKSRYLTLSILGARREQIKRSINQQVLWYFLLPLILACISGAVGIYAMQLYLYSGAAHLEQSYPLLIAMAVIVVLVMVIYGVAVARTANREIGKLNYKPNS